MAPKPDTFDDFTFVAGGAATRYAQEVADRIVAFLTAKGEEVATSISGGKMVALPVTIATADLQALEDKGRSLKGNTAYDYREAIVAAGFNYGTTWREDGDMVRLHLRAPRKTKSS